MSPKDMAKIAKEHGQKAIAITDHGTMAGAIQFIKACMAEDIKPIIGSEFYISKNHRAKSKIEQPDGKKGNKHLILLAKNFEGYKNLCRLSHISCLEGFYYSPRIDIDLLSKYSSGLICTSACLGGAINWNLYLGRYEAAKMAARIFKDIFGEDFYLEIMYHGISGEAKIIPDIQKISKELNIKTIITQDAHYAHREDSKYHDIILCLRDNKNSCIKNPKRFKFPSDEFYLKSTEEMFKTFGFLSQSMKNTLEISEKCDISGLKFGGMSLPKFQIPDDYKTSFDYLSFLAWEGLRKKKLDTNQKYIDRLKMELGDVKLIFDTKGYNFDVYFLMIHDIVKFICSRNIPYGVRGSGNGSLLLFALNVSKTDPIKYNLFWERFLGFEYKNGKREYARPGWPDVDIDICCERRWEVEQYAVEKYGKENVASIGNVGKLEIKSAIRKVIKVLDPSNAYSKENDWGNKLGGKDPNFQLENAICKSLPKIMKNEDGNKVETIKEARKLYPEFDYYMEKYPQIYDASVAIQKTISSYGKHAAGIILSPIPMSEICPLHITARKGGKIDIATQYTMEDVESVGLIKVDFLGLSTETSIASCVEMIKDSYGISLNFENMPRDDEKAFNILNSGKACGVFQCDSPGMQNTLREIGVSNVNDISVCISMFRPGPLQYISDYADRKHGRTQVEYAHPVMKKITEKTHGIICYQEQTLAAFVELAKLTYSDGYKFIKGCSKKKIHIVDEMTDKFVKSCIKNGVPKNIAEKIAKDLEKFSGYAFNMAHAMGYAVNETYVTSYLKAHFPIEFMAARLSVECKRRKDKLVYSYYEEAKRLGFKILPPDINLSSLDWQIVDQKTLREPLIVKNIGIKAAQEIIANRPYKNDDILRSFTLKSGRAISTKIVEAMYEAGIWGYDMSKDKIIDTFEMIKRDKKRKKPSGGAEIKF